MFYQTQIKSIGYGGAYDVSGKWLSFIGYLPVKVGDTVFTDGNIIFGNATPRGSAINFFLKHEMGVPVLAADLRGYFTQNGMYKPYAIAGENWIVNAKTIYSHDTDDSELIDAEIAIDDDGNEIGFYSVEKEIEQFADWDFSAHNVLYSRRRSRNSYLHTYYSLSVENLEALSTNSGYPITQSPLFTGANVEEKEFDFIKHDDIIKECTLTIRKRSAAPTAINEVEIIKLSDLMTNLEAFTHNKVNITINDHEFEDHTISLASILNFKINSDGSWVALIECKVCAERTFYEKTHMLQFQQIHTSNSYNVPVEGIDDLPEGSLKAAIIKLVRSLTAPSYYTVDTHNYSYTETVTDYTTPSSTFAIEECIFKINSDGDVELISQEGRYTSLYFIDIIDEVSSAPATLVTEDGTFPFVSSFTNGNYYTGTLTNIFEPQVYWLPADIKEEIDARQHIYHIRSTYRYNSRYLEDAPDYDNGISEVAETFTFPVQDGYFAKFVYSEPLSWQLDGIYNENGDEILNVALDDESTIMWNISFLPLKNGEYLIGYHNGYFYKVDQSGNVTDIYSDFKNFRLRELKKIDVAKK